jgi:phosphoribosylformylglycinamidine cyclo-ligase
MEPLTYRDAGVDIEKKEAALERIGRWVRGTFTPRVLSDHGSFGGMFAARFPGMEDPVLVATNDGVGTKVRLAARARRFAGLGHDIVNHCVNDALVQGAAPLFFLDYFAASRLEPAVLDEVVRGMAEACSAVGAALLGGETAEMPGVYAPGEMDVAGFLVGVVDRPRALPRGVAPGDALVAIRSDGLHTNGYSLVNRIVDRDDLDLDASPAPLKESLADALLRPHRCYLAAIERLRKEVDVHALAHVTGGGIEGNLPRVLPDGAGATVDRASWRPNPVFRWLVDAAGIDATEAYRVFNMGCGMLVAVPPDRAQDAVRLLGDAGEEAWVAGRVDDVPGVRLA